MSNIPPPIDLTGITVTHWDDFDLEEDLQSFCQEEKISSSIQKLIFSNKSGSYPSDRIRSVFKEQFSLAWDEKYEKKLSYYKGKIRELDNAFKQELLPAVNKIKDLKDVIFQDLLGSNKKQNRSSPNPDIASGLAKLEELKKSSPQDILAMKNVKNRFFFKKSCYYVAPLSSTSENLLAELFPKIIITKKGETEWTLDFGFEREDVIDLKPFVNNLDVTEERKQEVWQNILDCYFGKTDELDLSHCNLYKFPTEFSCLPGLKRLRLSNNTIDFDPEKCFLDIPHIEMLDLSYNHIQHVPFNCKNSRKLQVLNLTGNRLSSFPKGLFYHPALRTFSIEKNQIHRVPKEISSISKLQALLLSGNPIEELPDSIGAMEWMEYLHCEDMKLSALPKNIGDLSRLKELRLKNNSLASLPLSITNLKNLQVLTLDMNQFTSFPREVLSFRRLTSFSICDNHIAELPEEFGQLTRLQSLRLSRNRLTPLPDSLCNLSSLEELHCSGNNIVALPNSIGKLQKLTEVRLEKNAIKVLPDSFFDLPGLRVLGISNNPLVSLGPISKFKHLRALYASEMPQFTTIPEELCHLVYLQTLHMTNNSIASIPDNLKMLVSLRELKLDNNKLKDLSDSLYFIAPFLRSDNESHLSFTGNPIPNDKKREIDAALTKRERFIVHSPSINFPPLSLDHLYFFTGREKVTLPLDLDGNMPEKEKQRRSKKLQQLKNFVSVLMESRSFRKNIVEHSNLILDFLHFSAENELFSQKLYSFMTDVENTCGIEIPLKLTIPFGYYSLYNPLVRKNLNLTDFLLGMQRLEILEKEASLLQQEMGDPSIDTVELFYMLKSKLQEDLSLPPFAENLLYEEVSSLTQERIDSIKTKILKKTKADRVFVDSSLWREYIISIYRSEYDKKILPIECPERVENEPFPKYEERIKAVEKKREQAIADFVASKTKEHLSSLE